jgi:hypothetical protein
MFWFKKETQEEKLKRKYLENIRREKNRMGWRLQEELNSAIKNTRKSFEFTTTFEDELEIVCKELGVKFQFICERSLFDKGLKKFKIYGWADGVEEEPKLAEIVLGSPLKFSGTKLSVHDINKIRNKEEEEMAEKE